MNKSLNHLSNYSKGGYKPDREALGKKLSDLLSAALTDNRENELLGVQQLVVTSSDTEQALNDGPVTKYLYFSAHEANYRVATKVAKR